MIGAFERLSVAPNLDTCVASQRGGRMPGGCNRARDRRRGVMSLVGAVAAALPACREPRALRQRFEVALLDLLNARDVELRDGPVMPRPPQSTISVEVACGDLALGAIDAAFDDGACRFDEFDRQVLESARDVAALVLTIDRAHR